jgi:hypothetical protein
MDQRSHAFQPYALVKSRSAGERKLLRDKQPAIFHPLTKGDREQETECHRVRNSGNNY